MPSSHQRSRALDPQVRPVCAHVCPAMHLLGELREQHEVTRSQVRLSTAQ